MSPDSQSTVAGSTAPPCAGAPVCLAASLPADSPPSAGIDAAHTDLAFTLMSMASAFVIPLAWRHT